MQLNRLSGQLSFTSSFNAIFPFDFLGCLKGKASGAEVELGWIVYKEELWDLGKEKEHWNEGLWSCFATEETFDVGFPMHWSRR